MKKIYPALLCTLIVVVLCSCSFSKTGRSATYTVTKYGMDYVVDYDKGTISDGTYIYRYELSGGSKGYSINITYPDASTYWWTAQNNGSFSSGYGGWSDDYNENRYVDGRTLCDVLEENVPKEKESKNILVILFLFVIGIFNIVSPATAWYLEYGWRYKNAEPSGLALGMNRFGGVIAIIVAVIMIFV